MAQKTGLFVGKLSWLALPATGQPIELHVHVCLLPIGDLSEIVRSSDQSCKRYDPSVLERPEVAKSDPDELRLNLIRGHQKLGSKAVSLRFKIGAGVPNVHHQMANLVSHCIAETRCWHLFVQEDDMPALKAGHRDGRQLLVSEVAHHHRYTRSLYQTNEMGFPRQTGQLSRSFLTVQRLLKLHR